MTAAEVLAFILEIVSIIKNSSNPSAAMKRAITAAETEALNVAADEALKRL